MLEKLQGLKNLKKLVKTTHSVGGNGQYLIGLDIGTEFVKALIARVTPDGAQIVGVGRAHQELSDMQDGAIADIAAVVENCQLALSEAEKQAGTQARTAVIGIAGELVKGMTLNIIFQRRNATAPLDMAEMEQIIKRCQERALERAKKQLAIELGNKEIEVKLVNSALVSITIDGYKVTNPIGFQGRDVMVQLYSAFAPLVHIGALERTAQQLDLDLLAVAAEPFAVGRAMIGNDPNATTSAILMDVGGGTTDIAVLNEGGMEGTKMFGIGGRAFTKSVARDLNLEFHQAEVIKLALSTGRVPSNKVPIVEKALDKTMDVWVNGVELALSEFDKLDHLPHKLLLCGGGSSLKMLVDRLNTSEWYSDLPFTRKPLIQHIAPDQVQGIVDKTGSVNDHTYITAMGLLRVGCDTMTQVDVPSGNSIKDHVNRLLKV